MTPECFIIVPRTEEQTFKLGKHKGRLFSEVAENDVDYCNMVQASTENWTATDWTATGNMT